MIYSKQIYGLIIYIENIFFNYILTQNILFLKYESIVSRMRGERYGL